MSEYPWHDPASWPNWLLWALFTFAFGAMAAALIAKVAMAA